MSPPHRFCSEDRYNILWDIKQEMLILPRKMKASMEHNTWTKFLRTNVWQCRQSLEGGVKNIFILWWLGPSNVSLSSSTCVILSNFVLSWNDIRITFMSEKGQSKGPGSEKEMYSSSDIHFTHLITMSRVPAISDTTPCAGRMLQWTRQTRSLLLWSSYLVWKTYSNEVTMTYSNFR